MTELLFLTVTFLFAGFIDAIVGGGGLITIPSLLTTYPNFAPATLFGTNKSASIFGTAFATWQYQKRVKLRWKSLLPAAALGFLGSFIGAWVLTLISADFLRKLLPIILLMVLIYTVIKKDLGQNHLPRFEGRAELIAAGLIGLMIGFYDGFFGPGTGSFLVFLFVRWLGYDFLSASASAKLINTGTNLAAIILFAMKGHVLWEYTLILASANITGSLLGTRLALKHGTHFVRYVFIFVVFALIIKTGFDAFLK